MVYYKLKRPHSPINGSDSIGILNYKRIKLIEDFERLSLSDNNTVKHDRDPYAKNMCNPVTKVVKTKINLPKSVKSKVIRKVLSVHRDKDHMDSNEIIYSRIYDWIREDSMKLIPWVDWRDKIYKMWLHWYKDTIWKQTYKNYQPFFDNEGDYDIMDTFNEDNVTNHNNSILDNNAMDIDMDD